MQKKRALIALLVVAVVIICLSFTGCDPMATGTRHDVDEAMPHYSVK
jgi:hypothetical protein